MQKPAALAVTLLATLALIAPLSAQQPPNDETHKEIRKDVAEPQKEPDPRESKVPGEEAKDRADEQAKASREAKAERKEAKKDDDKNDEPKPVVTHGKVTIDGREFEYTATAGKMVMKTDEGDPKAEVFFIAYTKRGKSDADKKAKEKKKDGADTNANDRVSRDAKAERAAAKRPITFAFNGGPGSASVWLHLGMLGPKRVKLDSDARELPPPHELIPNEYSLLDKTDLVFIDPVSTGFSRPVKGEDKRQFHGYDEDLRSVGQFIHDYTTKYGRWKSPKFLIGESYGGLRAAGLAGELQDRYHLYLNGIVLVSAVVDFQTLMAGGNNDIAYALFLPTYATTAWYHKQLSDELQNKSVEEVNNEAEQFALGPYLRALAAGDSMSQERRDEVIARMAELTGLSKEYIDRANLRVPMFRFGKELLRDEGKIIGRFDSRYSGHALDRVDDTTDYDPSASAVFGTFTSALNDYLRTTLKVKEERVYEILTSRVHPWDYSEFTNRFVNASSTLREAMVQNPYLRVFTACGYYDLATPPFAMEHTRNHLNLPEELRDNFETSYYEGGHMMYAHEPSLAKLRKDLVKFYEKSLEPLEGADNGDEE
jgi:carboxypeptidase C (cathepsin A)